MSRPGFVGAVVLGVALLGPGTAGYAAGPAPPDLPSVVSGCVSASPVVARSVPWAQGRLAPASVWPLSTGTGVLVAVLDTGVSPAAAGLTGVAQHGVDVVKHGPADSDCPGRGTALAGIVAGRSVPDSPITGIAPGAGVVPIRVTDSEGRIPPGALAAGIQAAVLAGAQVILVGTGTPTPEPALRQAVDTAAVHNAVVVAPVASKGAGDPGQPTPVWYPAGYPGVVAVGGVDQSGSATEPVAKEARVDLVAPAVDAVAPGPAGGHYKVGGTVVAAAYVAGAAALLRSYQPELSAAQVAQRLKETAEPAPVGRDSRTLGAGTVDLYAAVCALDPAAVDSPVSLPVEAVTLPAPAAPDLAAAIAWRFAGGTIGLVALVLLAFLVVRQGRRRRWRP